MSSSLPKKIADQIHDAGLPLTGQHSFKPKLVRNKRGQQIIVKKTIATGPKKGKKGYVDEQGRIWVRDRAHANVEDHWDVQLEGGRDYFRVGFKGEKIP